MIPFSLLGRVAFSPTPPSIGTRHGRPIGPPLRLEPLEDRRLLAWFAFSGTCETETGPGCGLFGVEEGEVVEARLFLDESVVIPGVTIDLPSEDSRWDYRLDIGSDVALSKSNQQPPTSLQATFSADASGFADLEFTAGLGIPGASDYLVTETAIRGENFTTSPPGAAATVTGAWQVSDLFLPGDANTDFRFDQHDIVQVLASAKYLTGEPATWEQGDWNGDDVFDQRDLVLALQEGNYLADPKYCWDNDMCNDDEYCFFADCALETGECRPRPELCTQQYEPVCGCDGNTYGNECMAAGAGVSVDHEGPCGEM